MSANEMRIALEEAEPRARIGLALDRMTWKEIFRLLSEVGPYIGFVKSNALSRSRGVKLVRQLTRAFDFELMADAKCHDTARTMEDDVSSITNDGARLITVHASSHDKTLRPVVEARDRKRNELQEKLGDKYDPFVGTLLGITVLTLHDDQSCIEVYGAPVKPTVMKFAHMARRGRLDGVVSAVGELPDLQADEYTRDLLKVTPGIILSGGKADSGQERTATPGEAIELGADFIILGSAVTKAESPVLAAKLAVGEVTESLAG